MKITFIIFCVYLFKQYYIFMFRLSYKVCFQCDLHTYFILIGYSSPRSLIFQPPLHCNILPQGFPFTLLFPPLSSTKGSVLQAHGPFLVSLFLFIFVVSLITHLTVRDKGLHMRGKVRYLSFGTWNTSLTIMFFSSTYFPPNLIISLFLLT